MASISSRMTCSMLRSTRRPSGNQLYSRAGCSRPDSAPVAGHFGVSGIVARGAQEQLDIRVITGGKPNSPSRRKSAQVCTRKGSFWRLLGGKGYSLAGVDRFLGLCALSNLLRRIPDKQAPYRDDGCSGHLQQAVGGVVKRGQLHVVHELHRTGGTAQVQRARRDHSL